MYYTTAISLLLLLIIFSRLYFIQRIHRRQIHLGEILSKRLSIEEQLGLPRKPKPPLTGYYRFLNEHHAFVREKNPTLLPKKIVTLMAKMWGSVSADRKEEYAKASNDDKLNYIVQMSEYRRMLSEDDKKRIQEFKAKSASRKASLNKLKQRHALGMPRRPVNPFVKFFLEQKRDSERDEGKRKQTREEYSRFYKQIADKWRALSDGERAEYRSLEEVEDYK